MDRTSGARTAVACVRLFFFSSRRRHTRLQGDWSSDVCSSDLSTSITLASSPNSDFAVGDVFMIDQLYDGTKVKNSSVTFAHRPNRAYCVIVQCRSEERRVGKECRSRWSPYH